jgi:hypothetical protein
MWGSSHKLAKRVRRRFPNGGISTTYLGYIWKRVFFQQEIFGQDGLRSDVGVSRWKRQLVWVEVNLMLLVVVVIWLGSSVGGCKGCGMRPHTR